MTPLERHEANPVEQHQEALADLDRQMALARDITPTPWTLVKTSTLYMNGRAGFDIRSRGEPGIRLTFTSWPTDADLIVAAVNGFVAQLEGRKRILLRHAPEWCAEIDQGVWLCVADHGVIVEWEDCPDWRDAAGLPEGGDHG